VLHKLIYGRPGSKHENIKKSLLQFSGLVIKDKKADREKWEQKLDKLHVSQLKSALFLLTLYQSGTKEDLVKRLIDFLEKPDGESGKHRIKKTPSKKGKGKSKDDGDDEDDDDDDNDEGDNDDDDDEEEEEEDKKKEEKEKEKKVKGKEKGKEKEKVKKEGEKEGEKEEEKEDEDGYESDYESKKKAKKSRTPKKKAKKEKKDDDNEDEKEEKKEEEKSQEKKKKEDEEGDNEKEGNGHQNAPTDKGITEQMKIIIKEKPDISLRALREKLSEFFHVSMEDHKDFIRNQAIEIMGK